MGLSGWNNSKKLGLLIDSSKVDENLINFPVNITLSSGTGQTGFDTTAVFDELITVSGTKKIAITATVSGVETELYTEIERWDWDTEEANLWVKIPTVSSGTNTELYLYYDSDHVDNTDYIGDTGDSAAQNVWNNDFVGVWHMAQDPNGDVASAIKDSTSNVIHATPVGAMTTDDLVAGKIGKAINFDESNDYLKTAEANDVLNITTTLTLEAIIKPSYTLDSGLVGDVGIISRQHLPTADRDTYAFVINPSGKLHLGSYGGSIQSTKVSWALNTTFCIAGTYNSTGLTGDLFVDSIKETLTVNNYDNMAGGINSLAIAGSTAAYLFPGIIDEVRISNVVRSDAWIKATYYSNWNDLISFGAEEICLAFTFTDPTPAHLSTVYGTTEQVCLTTTISGEELNYVYDAGFYDGFDVQIGTTVSGIQSGQPAESNAYLSTPGGIDYSWYMIATSSGSEDTSDTYTFHNKFLASGTTKINGTLASGIDVRLYLRDTGELLGSTISTISGTFNIETQHNAEFYCVALSPYTDTNSLIYDFLEVD